MVAPDLVGFGRSDKPTRTSDYTYERHVDWMSQWLIANDLRHLTLVCQDWGSLIGLRLVTAFPDRFDRVVLGNGGLPTGDPEPNAAFKAWCEFSQKTPTFDTSKIIQGGCASKPLAPEVLAAYDAPYPDESYKAGARIFPTLVPASLDYPSSKENLAAWGVKARQYYYPNPVPGPFYSGATANDSFLGAPRDAYYAFEWGDALFISLDPFWYTSQGTNKSKDPWIWTLGRAQYDWLKATLEKSKATFKFVFMHHIVGGSFDNLARGGVEFAPYFEWGGKNTDDTPG